MNAVGAVARPERPNILLLMADQLRRDALGYTGCPGAHTPAIDALARGSVSFTNAVTPAPICVAARMSMITGLLPTLLTELGLLYPAGGNWRARACSARRAAAWPTPGTPCSWNSATAGAAG